LLAQFANYIDVGSAGNANFKDEKDNYLLDLAEHVDADFLVTGDKPLLELARHKNTRIISFTDLLEELD